MEGNKELQGNSGQKVLTKYDRKMEARKLQKEQDIKEEKIILKRKS